MQILALSDIHANVGVVSRLRERETNAYDLLIVAGDIGGSRVRDIADILDTFGCPVAYVYGNHDYDLAYDFDLGKNGHHLHGRPLVVGQVCLAGFSGCPTNWGLNPARAKLSDAFEIEEQSTHLKVVTDIKAIDEMPEAKRKSAWDKLERTKAFEAYQDGRKALQRAILAENRSELAEAMSRATRPSLFNIAVTHERLTKSELMGSVDCFIHGHFHQFSCRSSRGKRHLNVAALDKPVTVSPAGRRINLDKLSNVATGNYVTFEVADGAMRNLSLKIFGWNEVGWARVDGLLARGASVPMVGADLTRDCEEAIAL